MDNFNTSNTKNSTQGNKVLIHSKQGSNKGNSTKNTKESLLAIAKKQSKK